jgi:hypothetical protein
VVFYTSVVIAVIEQAVVNVVFHFSTENVHYALILSLLQHGNTYATPVVHYALILSLLQHGNTYATPVVQ